MFTAEILSIGNELLIGQTTNTNLTWLSSQITRLGGFVRRSLTVRDEIFEISEALTLAIQHQPNVLIVSGGLGPTFDDKTLQGIAYNRGLCLRVDGIALALIKARVKEINPGRLKMAHLPEGGKPLRNRVGTAPGVYLAVGQVHLFALPGVPSEMRSIFKHSVVEFMRRTLVLGSLYEAFLSSLGLPESKMAPIIYDVMNRFPEVYVKSHPLGMEHGRARIKLHLTSQTKSEQIQAVKELIVKKIRDNGGVIAAT